MKPDQVLRGSLWQSVRWGWTVRVVEVRGLYADVVYVGRGIPARPHLVQRQQLRSTRFLHLGGGFTT